MVIALVRKPSDGPVLRAALALGQTTVLCVAPPEVQPLVAAARAAGAARAIRVWDPTLADTDYLGIALTLASAVRALVAGELASSPLVILCGDDGRGAVGPSVAERLALPHLGAVLEAQIEGEAVVARRRSRALVRRYRSAPPVVLCLTGVGEPLAAAADKSGEVESWTLEQAGLTAAEINYRRRFAPHPSAGPSSAPRRFADVGELCARLRADGLLSPTGEG